MEQKARLQEIVNALTGSVPSMMGVMLKNYSQVWLNQVTDEQITQLVKDGKKMLAYIETGEADPAEN